MIHVVHIIANNPTVPYLTWFTERLKAYPDVKFSFIVLYPEEPPMVQEMKERGCKCYWIKFDTRKRKRGMIIAMFKLYRLFKILNPDVVNAHLFDDSLPALLAARLAGVKKRVIRKQDTAYHWYFKPVWVVADRFNNFNATDIIAISKDSYKFLVEKEKAPVKKMTMIYNGIPINDFTAQNTADKEFLVKKYGLEDKTVIGTIARYIEWKGYRYIIEAVKILTQKNKNLKFLFVGYGEQEQELEELVNKYDLTDYIVFTKWIDKKYIPSLYGIMDVYLHAAFMEPFGFVFVEAMANGVPIVTSRTGVAADVLEHKVTCYFTGDKDPKGIAEGVEWMLEHPAEKEAMKGKIRKMAEEQFGIDKMLE
ncbi:MAG TPA: glycosyltransferase family 4 protein, partial [Bacteroidia bacterium]|nr:glycosyltransferase family 4 protein [Bacteroidia bacterium]